LGRCVPLRPSRYSHPRAHASRLANHRLQRRRRFWTRSELPRWLARAVGGADVVIREDARWPDASLPREARLTLYTENESHATLIRVQEWCTYEAADADAADADAADTDAPDADTSSPALQRTRKRLHVRATVLLRAWWLPGLQARLEAFLVRRWLDSLQLGLAADDALCAQILAERADVADGADAAADAPPAPAVVTVVAAQARPRPPACPLAPCAAPHAPHAACAPRRRKRRLLPAVWVVAKVGVAALCARALPVAFALRR
jgi:hypothetical protein